MTTDELERAMLSTNERLKAEGRTVRVMHLAPKERLGSLVGPCWVLACATCRKEPHDGPCSTRLTP